MEIIILVVVICLISYFNNRINKMSALIDLSAKQTEAIVDFFIYKLKDKGIFTDNEIDSLYRELAQKVKKKLDGKE